MRSFITVLTVLTTWISGFAITIQDTSATDSAEVLICLPRGLILEMALDVKKGQRCDSLVVLLNAYRLQSKELHADQADLVAIYEQSAKQWQSERGELKRQLRTWQVLAVFFVLFGGVGIAL